MFWKKKGISPLIATVLIIGFTVALAAVIMVWGQGFIKGMQQKTEAGADVQLICAQDVAMEVSNACESVAGLKVTIKNDGSKPLKKITLRLYKSASDIATVELTGVERGGADGSDALDAFGADTFDVAMPTGMAKTAVNQVEGIPIVTIQGKDIPCAQSGNMFPLGALTTDANNVPVCPA